MIDASFQGSRPVINMLDHVQATITIIAPTTTLKSLLASVAALAVLWLMQANTRSAGFGSAWQVIRLVQRIAMSLLAIALSILAALPYHDGNYGDVVAIMILVPLLVMVACSIILGQLSMRERFSRPSKARVGRWH
jgi:hypothetical protein